jgi:lactose/L-arabinose transport system ATP-binding protein
VTLENVIKRYGATQVIHGVDLEIEDGEFCVFVGPSGCGKSTLLRMVAGLEETTGAAFHRRARRDPLDPAERGVAMVFQTYALYPHMTVEENMGFGLKMTGHPKAEIKAKVAEASRILKLDDYLAASPRRCRAGSASASPSGAPSCGGRRCSCSTSRCRTSMPSCASRCGSRSRGCTRRSARR